MAEHLLQLRRYAENGTTLLATINLNTTGAISDYGYRLRKRIPSFHKFKDQWQNSPVLDGRQLVDFRQDVQVETIIVDAEAINTKRLQYALSVLNDWMRVARQGQKNKNQGNPYISTSLWVNPLQGMTAASHTEVLAMDVDGLDEYFGGAIVANRAENITITLTLAPYWTASELDLYTSAGITNGASNYTLISSDTTEYTVTNAALTSNVATLTFSATHTFIEGEWITNVNITAASAVYDGTYKIASAPTDTTITFARTNADIASATSTGTTTANYIRGTRAAATRHKLAGGGSATNKIMIGVRKQGDVANFTTHHLWAKDATLDVSTTSGTSANFDGNGTGSYTITTASATSETRTHRWTVTTNPADQYGTFRAFLRARQNTADRYTARMGVTTTDGTNVGTVSYSLSTPVNITTDSGNALAFVDLGTIVVPPKLVSGATVYGIVYDLYLTCANTAASPTASVDGLWLFPVGEGEDETGFVIATYDFGTGAAGVGGAFVSALEKEPTAYLADASDVVTFPTLNIEEGTGILLEPQREYRVYYALIDESTSAGNPRHDFSTALTVTADYEVRYGLEGRTDT